MRTLAAVAVAVVIPAVVWAQDSSKKKPNAVTLTGCVQRSQTSPNQFTIQDESGIYRLTGMDLRQYFGHRVEVVGGTPARLKIAGGLKPSPNIAGQAGAIDPVRAATAIHDGATQSGTGPEMELKVRSIKSIDGSCESR